MPDICFHFSSETADAAGQCPGGDRTRITMPIEPALQIPRDAKPVCWLHNLAFNNAMANIAASDGSNKCILATGDGALTFQNGTQSANAPFIGFKYTMTDADGTSHDMALVAPLSKEHGLNASPYNVHLNSTSDDGTVDIEWSGIPATLDGSDSVLGVNGNKWEAHAGATAPGQLCAFDTAQGRAVRNFYTDFANEVA